MLSFFIKVIINDSNDVFMTVSATGNRWKRKDSFDSNRLIHNKTDYTSRDSIANHYRELYSCTYITDFSLSISFASITCTLREATACG